MELPSRFELLSQNYKFRVLPLNYGSIMAGDAGFKPAMQEYFTLSLIEPVYKLLTSSRKALPA